MSCLLKQQGVVLVSMFMLIIIFMSVYFMIILSGNKYSIQQQQNTRDALAAAKQALIDYSLSYYERKSAGHYGVLPCPEMSASISNGRQVTPNCGRRNQNIMGRLPWYTLGISALLDGSGECLWYAVSAGYKYGTSAKTLMLNSDTPGMLELVNEKAVRISSKNPENRIVALIISPGSPLDGQLRKMGDINILCKRDRADIDIRNYLDAYNNIDNAQLSDEPDRIDQFIINSSINNKKINDQMIAIYRSDIFLPIQKNANFKRRLTNLTEILAQCIANFGKIYSCVEGPACLTECKSDYKSCLLNGAGNKDQKLFCTDIHYQCLAACNICGPLTNNNTGFIKINLPRPSPLDLDGTDYRVTENYSGISEIEEQDPAKGLLGRYMYDIHQAVDTAEINNIFEVCTSVDINSLNHPVNMLDTKDEYRHLWNDWKDHFFYLVGSDLTAPDTNKTCQNNCPRIGLEQQINGAVVWFSGPGLDHQRRLSVPPENTYISIPPRARKSLITNYLEFDNTDLFPDMAGNKVYQKSPVSNDIAFCISPSMQVRPCPP